jgi:UDP-GlcNAc3NAcA epimerase
MQDLAAMKLPEIRDAEVLTGIARDAGLTARGMQLATGRFLYSTIHRQENREPDAVRHWSELLNRAATRERPVILALHPGTRAALETQGIQMSEFVALVEPLGYRSSLALQLHSAAVLTDSGGIQREAAWLGTPCLVLRGTTEWLEAVADAHGEMVLVGRDVDLALETLAELVPPGTEDRAARRAATASVPEVGAAEAISGALAGHA